MQENLHEIWKILSVLLAQHIITNETFATIQPQETKLQEEYNLERCLDSYNLEFVESKEWNNIRDERVYVEEIIYMAQMKA